MNTVLDKTLCDVERFLVDTGMKEREFGLRCANCHKLIKRLRIAISEGKDMKSTTLDKINNFIINYYK